MNMGISKFTQEIKSEIAQKYKKVSLHQIGRKD